MYFTNIFQSICIGELISRGIKHIFKTYLQGVEMMSLTAAISHFLNCYLGSYPTPHANINSEVVSNFSYVDITEM